MDRNQFIVIKKVNLFSCKFLVNYFRYLTLNVLKGPHFENIKENVILPWFVVPF